MHPIHLSYEKVSQISTIDALFKQIFELRKDFDTYLKFLLQI